MSPVRGKTVRKRIDDANQRLQRLDLDPMTVEEEDVFLVGWDLAPMSSTSLTSLTLSIFALLFSATAAAASIVTLGPSTASSASEVGFRVLTAAFFVGMALAVGLFAWGVYRVDFQESRRVAGINAVREHRAQRTSATDSAPQHVETRLGPITVSFTLFPSRHSNRPPRRGSPLTPEHHASTVHGGSWR